MVRVRPISFDIVLAKERLRKKGRLEPRRLVWAKWWLKTVYTFKNGSLLQGPAALQMISAHGCGLTFPKRGSRC